MKLNKMLGLVALTATVGLSACGKTETLYGEYSETFGKAQTVYVTKVNVSVKGDTIVKVEMAEGSDHYTKDSAKWASTTWTDKEADVLASFEGKSVKAILASESNEVFEVVASATVTSERIYKAVVNALSSR